MTNLKISQVNGVTRCTFEIEDNELQQLERLQLNRADGDIPYLSALKAALVLEAIFQRLHNEAIDKALDQ
ncbi:hypothetical protein WH297_19285 [Ochrobactrum vermis]|uniref:Uncharacterized protein n=1 Tax=Ochrobactrum vermis TaxID=1827297 RepID=A0ABU8PHY3_9HYPH|nr:hypothetical protein [Ochrobactrum vermis]PQZ26172.1 hypothetical protein CQZ93_19585 [Ochrobactrum vermis]